jgi:oxygen-dependent protoporphyrinogen oxidase
LVRAAGQEMAETLGIESTPILARVFRWPNGMPQYILGHLERAQRVDADLANHTGLALAGALRGIGIPDCIASGEAAAEQVAGGDPRGRKKRPA